VTPLPPALGGPGELIAWRLDRARHAPAWEAAEGAFRAGGRWSSKGVRAVYCALDPATAILEVAVHKGFEVLDADPHALIQVRISDPSGAHVVRPGDVPNPNWLRPGTLSRGQQEHGDRLLAAHPFVVVPSVVSTHSWNLVFTAAAAAGRYEEIGREPFALDPRLNPAV
jgi:RES domain-containing protein